jgi:zinc finger MYND domain-containing protein 10
MAIESLSIIQFISDHLSSLTLAVAQQLVEQCDIFCVLVPLMESKPWVRRQNGVRLVFENQHWTKAKDGLQLPKAEAQIWLTVYNLFLSPDVRGKYELNSFRKQNLLRLRKFINETVVDQIPVLGALLRALEELALMGDSLPSRISAFVIQQMPEIQDRIVNGQDWEEIARFQKERFFVENEQEQKRAVELMMNGIEEMLEEPACAQCGENATQRCSGCKNEWYCSRKCQVAGWKKHKEICALMKDEMAGEGKKEVEKRGIGISEI